MTDTKVQRFKFTIPILKTSVKIVKDKDGNEVEERYLDGVASGTDLDYMGIEWRHLLLNQWQIA